MLEQSARWLRENAGPERYELLRAIAHVAAGDGVLRDAERAFLYEVADKLDIPKRAADEIAFETLADHLQMRAVHGTNMPQIPLARSALAPGRRSAFGASPGGRNFVGGGV